MTIHEIEHILQQGEGLKIEFKEATDHLPRSFYETVVSFSNTWHQKSTQLTELKWFDNQTHKINEIEKVPSWPLKSTQLLQKKYCSTEFNL
jgi:predicted HTH transcriptional regulator